MQGKELQVAKKRVGRYPKEFRRMAVERLKNCDNILALSRELGVHRRLLYKWRDQLDPVDLPEESLPQNSRESLGDQSSLGLLSVLREWGSLSPSQLRRISIQHRSLATRFVWGTCRHSLRCRRPHHERV